MYILFVIFFLCFTSRFFVIRTQTSWQTEWRRSEWIFCYIRRGGRCTGRRCLRFGHGTGRRRCVDRIDTSNTFVSEVEESENVRNDK